MKVLIACEYSGVVRDAFIAKGHEAMSCDLLDTESPGPHYTGDLFDVIDYPWDIAIFHPPCTDLAVSGAAWFAQNQQQRLHYLPPSEDRWKERSKTYQGIADAMASQWGNLLELAA